MMVLVAAFNRKDDKQRAEQTLAMVSISRQIK
jgi:hypothetical protein